MDEDEDLSIEDMAELFDNVKMRPLPEDVISGIQEEQPWIKCLLILHLLPRLEEVRISSSTPRFERLLSQMMQHRLLSPNLRMVNRTATQGTVDADTLVPAFLYPSVTEIHGYHIVSNEMETQCEWLLPRGTTFASFFGTSNVERIELYASSLDTDVIEGLLQLPRALKTFLYSNSGTEHERMKLGFGEALAYTSDSLENLSVRWKETRGWAESDYTWTLHYFAGLESLPI
ncbi:hypothetical protein CPB86DRAFT_789632 [Serendipita vermifera]|nr:hypothetical protein CPB86DRAFT_789632 [Serendipita vermifera]